MLAQLLKNLYIMYVFCFVFLFVCTCGQTGKKKRKVVARTAKEAGQEEKMSKPRPTQPPTIANRPSPLQS